MGNSESSSSNNDDGNTSKIPNWDHKKKPSLVEEEKEEETNLSALKIGAAVAGSALLALGAYTLASSSSTLSSDGESSGRKRVTQMQKLEPERVGSSSGGGSSYNFRDHGPYSGNSNRCSTAQMIKIMSYNVWFREDVEVHERMTAIGKLIEEHSPDIIFFQEVTPNIYKIFQASNWWRMYRCSVSPENATRRYFCMLLSKLPVKQFISKPFEITSMGRELCAAEIDTGADKKLIAATTHLESPTPPEMNSVKRKAQAKEALGLLNLLPNVIFGGDMNWDEMSDGHFPLGEGWHDAWSVLKPRVNGWTYDTKSNRMLKGNFPLWKRLDRFVCKLKDFRLVSIEMIGMNAIPVISYYKKGKELPVLPSDHYGLVLTICPI